MNIEVLVSRRVMIRNPLIKLFTLCSVMLPPCDSLKNVLLVVFNPVISSKIKSTLEEHENIRRSSLSLVCLYSLKGEGITLKEGYLTDSHGLSLKSACGRGLRPCLKTKKVNLREESHRFTRLKS